MAGGATEKTAFELDFEETAAHLKEEQEGSSGQGLSLCSDMEAPKNVVCLGSSR